MVRLYTLDYNENWSQEQIEICRFLSARQLGGCDNKNPSNNLTRPTHDTVSDATEASARRKLIAVPSTWLLLSETMYRLMWAIFSRMKF